MTDVDDNAALRPAIGRIWSTWGVLIAATVAAVAVAARGPSAVVTVIVVLLAAVKAALVIGEFMEVRRGPLWLIAACCTWLLVVGIGLIVLMA